MKIYAENDIDIDIITNISVGTLQQTRILVVSVVVKLWSFVRDSYDSLSDVGEIRVYQRADFQSGSRVLKKVF